MSPLSNTARMAWSTHGGGGKSQRFGQLSGAAGLLAEQLHRVTAHRIGERGKGCVETHRLVTVRRPDALSQSSGIISTTVTAKVQMWPSGSRAR